MAWFGFFWSDISRFFSFALAKKVVARPLSEREFGTAGLAPKV